MVVRFDLLVISTRVISSVPTEQDKGVNCLAFLKQRVKRRLPGTLVVGGPYGYVHIWDAIYKASLVAQFGLVRPKHDGEPTLHCRSSS